jgi:hypothetical protein
VALLKSSGKLEVAQQIANHESPQTKLYDRRHDEISLDEIERECDVTLALGDPGVYPGSAACVPNKASPSAQCFCFARRGAHRKAVEDSLRLAHVFP